MNYGDRIKSLRMTKKITQNDLADGITSQGMISKIEKGLVQPDIEILTKIAKRFGISLVELIDENENIQESIDKDYIQSLLYSRNYVLLEKKLKNYNTNENLTDFDSAYLEWLESIVLTKNYGDFMSALSKAKHSLSLLNNKDKNSIDLKVQLYNGIGTIFTEQKEYENAVLWLNEGLTVANLAIVDWRLKQKIHYSLARCYALKDNFQLSLSKALTALGITTENNSLILLDDILLLLVTCHYELKDYDQANKILKQAESIITLKNNTVLIPYLVNIKELLRSGKGDETI